MELQALPSSSAKAANYTVCPDKRSVMSHATEQKIIEEAQLAHDSSTANQAAACCSLFLLILAFFLILCAAIFIGIYYGSGDGVNMRGQSIEQRMRPFLHIGLGCLLPGILCIAVAIPLIRHGKKSKARRVELLMSRAMPNYRRPNAS